MLLRHFVLPGVVLPALVCGALALCDPILFRRDAGRPSRGARSGGPAVAAAFLATFIAIGAMPRMPPAEVLGWLFWLVALAGLAGIFWDAYPIGARAVLAVVLAAALAWLTLRPLAGHTWTPVVSAVWLAAAATVTIACAWGFQELADDDEAAAATSGWKSGWVASGTAILVSAGAALTLSLSATARAGQLAGALAVALLACAAVRLLLRARWPLPGSGGSLPIAMAHSGLLLSGFFYAELRASGWLALALAPAAAALARRAAGSSPRRARVVAWIVVVALVALAAAPAIWSTATAEPGLYDY